MSVRRTATRSTRAARVSFVIAIACAITLVAAGSAGAEATAVGLGTASSFAVLGGTTVTNTGTSVISGDVGVSPGTAVTGFPPGLVLDGTIHSADALAASAQADATTAFNALAAEATSVTISADLGGTTLDPGVYTGTSLGLTGTVTLDAHGDPDAAFVFQAATTLTTAGASSVSLIGGATACNVYWQIGSSATLGANSVFVGTILSHVSITATTGAIVSGRLLAGSGAVTLDSNTVTSPTCPPDTTPTTSPITTTPITTTPVTTTPVTTTPVTTAPPTTTPGTTAPPTTTPGTTAPPTTAPPTTAPPTTAPPTTAPPTTAPPTTAPPTTAPPTTAPATSASTPITPATPSTSPPGLVITPPTVPGSPTPTTTGLEVTPPTLTGSTTSTTPGLEVTPPTLTEVEASTTIATRQVSQGPTPPATAITTTDLARTGSNMSGLVIVGLTATCIGIALTFASRRTATDR